MGCKQGATLRYHGDIDATRDPAGNPIHHKAIVVGRLGAAILPQIIPGDVP